MCLSPIKIKNVNKGSAHLGLNFLKDCDNEYMYAPCGHCPECVAAKQSQLVQRIVNESKYNHLFFCTLTYDNKHLPILEIEVPVASPDAFPSVVCDDFDFDAYEGSLFEIDKVSSTEFESGYLSRVEQQADYEVVKFPYADIRHVQLLLKRLRDNWCVPGRDVRYVAVSELGKQNGRPHFHILFLVSKQDSDYDGPGGRINLSKMHSLEKSLYTAVFKYWSVNVGTRKKPVYEKLFTYRKRFVGNKCYTNFDLHYVDPSQTTDGEANVAYYVSKYIMKGSQKEVRRQQFLRLNLSEEEYSSVWNIIKCRMLCSKGLGLDGRLEYIEQQQITKIPDYEYVKLRDNYIASCNDLPDERALAQLRYTTRVIRRRILIPNFDLAEEIRKHVRDDIGKTAGPTLPDVNGKHRPLAHYYQRFSYIYTTADALDYWFNTPADVVLGIDPAGYTKEQIERKMKEHRKRLIAIDCNSTFDTSPVLLDPSHLGNHVYNPIC